MSRADAKRTDEKLLDADRQRLLPLLARCLPDPDEILLVCEDAGLDRTRLELDDATPLTRWDRVLTEASREGRLRKVLELAAVRCPGVPGIPAAIDALVPGGLQGVLLPGGAWWRTSLVALVLLALLGLWWWTHRPPPLALEAWVLRESPGGHLISLVDGSVVRPGERMRVGFRPEQDAYVAVYRVAPDGRSGRIYPPEGTATPRWSAGWRSFVPAEGWLEMDAQVGPERLLVVAARAPVPEVPPGSSLLELYAPVATDAGAARAPRQGELAGAAVDRLDGPLTVYRATAHGRRRLPGGGEDELEVAWIWITFDHRTIPPPPPGFPGSADRAETAVTPGGAPAPDEIPGAPPGGAPAPDEIPGAPPGGAPPPGETPGAPPVGAPPPASPRIPSRSR
jgi:hypothetical protein